MAQTSSLTKTAIVAAFFSMLALPVIQMRTRAFRVTPLNENRNRAPRPGRLKDWGLPIFIERSRKWFDDNYGFRDLLIRAKTQFDYSLFHVSDRIYIGAKGWLYYRSVIDSEQPRAEALTDVDLANATGRLEQIRDYLSARKIKFIVVTVQLKDKFYPEYLPYAAAKARKFHRFDDFRARLHTIPGITYIDTTDALFAVKLRRRIFNQTDFHWNDPAAFEIARILVNTIAQDDGRGRAFWTHSLSIDTKRGSGGQAMFMPLFHPPEEDMLLVTRNWTSSIVYDKKPQAPFEWSSRMPLGKTILPGSTVLFGDSFADGMFRSGLADYFQEFHRARINVANLSDVLTRTPSDTRYFIFEFIEVVMPNLVRMPLH